MFEIEKGIPIPPKTVNGRGKTKYPFKSMEVGDSFFVGSQHTWKIIRSAASAYSRKYGGRFETRKDGDGFRFWRTE